MDAMVILLVYGFFVTVVAIAFIVLVHMNFKEALYHCMNSYDKSIHAHDDASVRVADHRRLDNERIKMIAHWGEEMAKTAHELSQFVLADVNSHERIDPKKSSDDTQSSTPQKRPHANPSTRVVGKPSSQGSQGGT